LKLKRLFADRWTICAIVVEKGTDEHCPIQDFFVSPGPQHAKSADGLLQLLEYVASEPSGPRKLPDSRSHVIDQAERIWEFIKGDLRIAWFYDEGQVVICTHCFVKASQKTPVLERRRAVEARRAYLESKRTHTLTIEDQDE